MLILILQKSKKMETWRVRKLGKRVWKKRTKFPLNRKFKVNLDKQWTPWLERGLLETTFSEERQLKDEGSFQKECCRKRGWKRKKAGFILAKKLDDSRLGLCRRPRYLKQKPFLCLSPCTSIVFRFHLHLRNGFRHKLSYEKGQEQTLEGK